MQASVDTTALRSELGAVLVLDPGSLVADFDETSGLVWRLDEPLRGLGVRFRIGDVHVEVECLGRRYGVGTSAAVLSSESMRSASRGGE